jgi:phosphatidylcholine synthase
MIASAKWLPAPAWLWICIPLIASAFAFVHAGAKEEADGFFRGFPSYWNVHAFYTAVWLVQYGPGVVLAITLFLSGLSLLPVRFVYPNRAPRWRLLFVWGGLAWIALVVAMLWFDSPAPVSRLLLWISLVYPVSYTVASLYLDWQVGRTR